jgi:hypothetical protein
MKFAREHWEVKMRHSYFRILAGCGALAAPLLHAPAASAETRGYMISWFATATYNLDFKANCPEDRNGGGLKVDIRDLMEVGLTEAQAVAHINNTARDADDTDYGKQIRTRARINGQPASIYNYPEATRDPNIETSKGKFAFGFNLDGKTKDTDFVDPETGEHVDHQLWRAVGCTESFRATPPAMPYPEELSWNLMIDTMPAWALRITGDDLSKDGPVTITLDRTIQHLERDATGAVMSQATFVIDPSPRSHNVLKGEMKGGVITIVPQDIYLEAEHPYYAEIDLKKTHMRIKLKPDGKLEGYWGGYYDWQKFMYMYTSRPANGADSIGMYHAVKKMADADPDPATGQNRMISTTFRMEAVPAFHADMQGKIIASPALRPEVGVAATAPATAGAPSK